MHNRTMDLKRRVTALEMDENEYKRWLEQCREHKVKQEVELTTKEADNVHLRDKIMEREDEINRQSNLIQNDNREHDEAILVERNKYKFMMETTEEDKWEMHNRIVDLEERLTALQMDLKEREEELTASSELNNVLVMKERSTNDELQDVRKELIKYLMEYASSSRDIGIKRMGMIDDEAFSQALRRSFHKLITDERIAEICSYWKERLMDPNWHPLKTVQVPGTGVHQLVVDTDDETVNLLKLNFGERVCEIVMTALKELNEYNSSGRFPEPELWNYKKNRKATLKEVISFLHSQGKRLKRKSPAC